MSRISSLCVYCGSSDSVDPVHREAAAAFGRLCAAAGIAIVFGGGRIGLMGCCADAAMAAGGEVIGVIPHHLNAVEIGHQNITRLHLVDSMHQRKQLMFELSDAFIVLPGGIGTLDEAFEIITWRHLNLHDKPVVIVDNDGYWQPFVALVDHLIDQGFAQPAVRELLPLVARVEEVLPALLALPDPARADRL
mgnify:FL=1